MRSFALVTLLALIQFIFLSLYTSQISISTSEANVFFEHKSMAGILSYYSCQLFGTNDFTARAPFLMLHFASTIILFVISKDILKKESDRVIATLFYMFLPGVNMAALLINKAVIVIFMTLVFLLSMKKNIQWLSYTLLVIFAIIDNAFAILFLALIFYAIKIDNKNFIITGLILFGINMFLFGFNDGGKPKSMFLDTLGVYFAIFSPFVFVYFLGSIYKFFRNHSSQIVLYISFWALVFSLLLSIRQKIQFEDFAPFVVLSVLFMVSTFFASYRVRLRPFRGLYKVIGYAISASLIVSFLSIFCSKLLYPYTSKPNKNFGYNYHIAKELAVQLKAAGIDNLKSDTKETEIRLRFYGIQPGNLYELGKSMKPGSKKVTITYNGYEVESYYVTKVNTL